jgi:hypothetical protein
MKSEVAMFLKFDALGPEAQPTNVRATMIGPSTVKTTLAMA